MHEQRHQNFFYSEEEETESILSEFADELLYELELVIEKEGKEKLLEHCNSIFE